MVERPEPSLAPHPRAVNPGTSVAPSPREELPMRPALTSALLLATLAINCRMQPAELTLDLAGPAVADPQVFHGNCFAGWVVRVELRVRETRGVAVVVERLAYRLADEGRGVDLGAEVLDAPAIDVRYGDRVVEAGGSRVFGLCVPSAARPVGPIAFVGDIAGLDDNGNPVAARFRLSAASLTVRDPVPGQEGACPDGVAGR
jgi:hypothetical protein